MRKDNDKPPQHDLFGEPQKPRRKRQRTGPNKAQRETEALKKTAMREGWRGALDALAPYIASGDLTQIRHKLARLRV